MSGRRGEVLFLLLVILIRIFGVVFGCGVRLILSFDLIKTTNRRCVKIVSALKNFKKIEFLN